MRYEISGTVMQTLAVDLDPGESVFSQTNCMCWMNDAVGGILGSLFGGKNNS